MFILTIYFNDLYMINGIIIGNDEIKRTYLFHLIDQYSDLDIIENTDILYMTRIQTERLHDEIIDIEYIENNLYLTQEVLTNAKNNIVIMHPLPRNQEISREVDSDPRAAYFRQMDYGLWLRMAILYNLFA